MLEDAALWFIALGAATFLIAGIWAPFETLAWWAGHHARASHAPTPPSEDHHHPIQHFVVYLGGIDSIDGTEHTDYERPSSMRWTAPSRPARFKRFFPTRPTANRCCGDHGCFAGSGGACRHCREKNAPCSPISSTRETPFRCLSRPIAGTVPFLAKPWPSSSSTLSSRRVGIATPRNG
jgi:hypothetical protein